MDNSDNLALITSESNTMGNILQSTNESKDPASESSEETVADAETSAMTVPSIEVSNQQNLASVTSKTAKQDCGFPKDVQNVDEWLQGDSKDLVKVEAGEDFECIVKSLETAIVETHNYGIEAGHSSRASTSISNLKGMSDDSEGVMTSESLMGELSKDLNQSPEQQFVEVFIEEPVILSTGLAPIETPLPTNDTLIDNASEFISVSSDMEENFIAMDGNMANFEDQANNLFGNSAQNEFSETELSVLGLQSSTMSADIPVEIGQGILRQRTVNMRNNLEIDPELSESSIIYSTGDEATNDGIVNPTTEPQQSTSETREQTNMFSSSLEVADDENVAMEVQRISIEESNLDFKDGMDISNEGQIIGEYKVGEIEKEAVLEERIISESIVDEIEINVTEKEIPGKATLQRTEKNDILDEKNSNESTSKEVVLEEITTKESTAKVLEKGEERIINETKDNNLSEAKIASEFIVGKHKKDDVSGEKFANESALKGIILKEQITSESVGDDSKKDCVLEGASESIKNNVFFEENLSFESTMEETGKYGVLEKEVSREVASTDKISCSESIHIEQEANIDVQEKLEVLETNAAEKTIDDKNDELKTKENITNVETKLEEPESLREEELAIDTLLAESVEEPTLELELEDTLHFNREDQEEPISMREEDIAIRSLFTDSVGNSNSSPVETDNILDQEENYASVAQRDILQLREEEIAIRSLLTESGDDSIRVESNMEFEQDNVLSIEEDESIPIPDVQLEMSNLLIKSVETCSAPEAKMELEQEENNINDDTESDASILLREADIAVQNILINTDTEFKLEDSVVKDVALEQEDSTLLTEEEIAVNSLMSEASESIIADYTSESEIDTELIKITENVVKTIAVPEIAEDAILSEVINPSDIILEDNDVELEDKKINISTEPPIKIVTDEENDNSNNKVFELMNEKISKGMDTSVAKEIESNINKETSVGVFAKIGDKSTKTNEDFSYEKIDKKEKDSDLKSAEIQVLNTKSEDIISEKSSQKLEASVDDSKKFESIISEKIVEKTSETIEKDIKSTLQICDKTFQKPVFELEENKVKKADAVIVIKSSESFNDTVEKNNASTSLMSETIDKTSTENVERPKKSEKISENLKEDLEQNKTLSFESEKLFKIYTDNVDKTKKVDKEISEKTTTVSKENLEETVDCKKKLDPLISEKIAEKLREIEEMDEQIEKSPSPSPQKVKLIRQRFTKVSAVKVQSIKPPSTSHAKKEATVVEAAKPDIVTEVQKPAVISEASKSADITKTEIKVSKSADITKPEVKVSEPQSSPKHDLSEEKPILDESKLAIIEQFLEESDDEVKTPVKPQKLKLKRNYQPPPTIGKPQKVKEIIQGKKTAKEVAQDKNEPVITKKYEVSCSKKEESIILQPALPEPPVAKSITIISKSPPQIELKHVADNVPFLTECLKVSHTVDKPDEIIKKKDALPETDVTISEEVKITKHIKEPIVDEKHFTINQVVEEQSEVISKIPEVVDTIKEIEMTETAVNPDNGDPLIGNQEKILINEAVSKEIISAKDDVSDDAIIEAKKLIESEDNVHSKTNVETFDSICAENVINELKIINTNADSEDNVLSESNVEISDSFDAENITNVETSDSINAENVTNVETSDSIDAENVINELKIINVFTIEDKSSSVDLSDIIHTAMQDVEADLSGPSCEENVTDIKLTKMATSKAEKISEAASIHFPLLMSRLQDKLDAATKTSKAKPQQDLSSKQKINLSELPRIEIKVEQVVLPTTSAHISPRTKEIKLRSSQKRKHSPDVSSKQAITKPLSVEVDDLETSDANYETAQYSLTPTQKERKIVFKQIPRPEQRSSPKITIKPIKPPSSPEVSSKKMKHSDESSPTRLTIKSSNKQEPLKITFTKQKTDDSHSILKIYQPEDHSTMEDVHVPRMTIKPRQKSDEMQHSPKITIKPVKPPISPKVTVKPVLPPNDQSSELTSTPKSSSSKSHLEESYPKVTIKPVLKPEESHKSSQLTPRQMKLKSMTFDSSSGVTVEPVCSTSSFSSHKFDQDSHTKMPSKSYFISEESSTSKLSIKPITKTCEIVQSDLGSSSSLKLTIKPLKSEESYQSPKITIKPIVKPDEYEKSQEEIEKPERIILKIQKTNLPSPKERSSTHVKESKREPEIKIEAIPHHEMEKNQKLDKIKLKLTKEGGHAQIIPTVSHTMHTEPFSLKRSLGITESTVSEKRMKSEFSDMLHSADVSINIVEPNTRPHPKQITEEITIMKIEKTVVNKPSTSEHISQMKFKEMLLKISQKPDITCIRHVPTPQQQPQQRDDSSSSDDVKIVEVMSDPLADPLTLHEDSNSQDVVIVNEIIDTNPFKNVQIIDAHTVNDSPVQQSPKRRGRPRKNPLEVKPEIKGEDCIELDATRPKRTCRAPAGRTPFAIKERKPRGAGRGRGSPRGARGGAKIIKETKASRAKALKEAKALAKIEAAKLLSQEVVIDEITIEDSTNDTPTVTSVPLFEDSLKKPEVKEPEMIIEMVEPVVEPEPEPEGEIEPDPECTKESPSPVKEEEASPSAEEESSKQPDPPVAVYEDETRMSASENNSRAQTPARQDVFIVPFPEGHEESQSSVQSTATTESIKNKKGRLEICDPDSAVTTVEQIVEYSWANGGPYMLQEQIAQYLGVKSFKRKYPGLNRRPVEMQERDYIREKGLVSESMCDMGLTAVPSSEILDIMYSDFQEKYEEYRKCLRDKQSKEISNKQKAISLATSQEKNKLDFKERAIRSAQNWNTNFNKVRKENRKCCMDLQTFTVNYPSGVMQAKVPYKTPVGHYPVALVPGQYTDYWKNYNSSDLNYLPLNTVRFGPMLPNKYTYDGGQSDGSSESDSSSGSDSDSSDESMSTEDEVPPSTPIQLKTPVQLSPLLNLPKK